MRTPLASILCSAVLAAALLLPIAPASALSLAGLFGSPVDAELAAQVPQDKRGPMNRADYDLACANQDVELAKLKEELADKQADLASQNTKLAKAQARAAEIALDIVKMDAIISNGLGKAEDNRKVIDGLTTDRTKNEAERIQLKAKVEQTELYVRDWTQRVAVKARDVAAFKARRGGDASQPAGQPAGKAVPKASAPAAQPVEEPAVIINQEPTPPPAGPAPAPEADLKN